MDSCSTSSSSDDEQIVFLDVTSSWRLMKNFQGRLYPVDHYSQIEFQNRFRFSKRTVFLLADIFSEKLSYLNLRNHPLTVIDQILIALRFYATGSFQCVLGDLIGVSQPTVCRTVKRVTTAIASESDNFIKMPTREEQSKIKRKFFSIGNIPNIIGLIDGTHVPINSPGGENPELFRNRKGYFSINTQVVVDSSNKIIDIVARWFGSCHDQTIFNFSLLKIRMERRDFENGILLGDSGYACKNYLLTPLRNPVGRQQALYNKNHKLIRHNVECAIGHWKKRFPCIQTRLRLKIENVLTTIVATAVLHNISIQQNEPEPSPPEVLIEELYNVPIPTRLNRTEARPENMVQNLVIRNM